MTNMRYGQPLLNSSTKSNCRQLPGFNSTPSPVLLRPPCPPSPRASPSTPATSQGNKKRPAIQNVDLADLVRKGGATGLSKVVDNCLILFWQEISELNVLNMIWSASSWRWTRPPCLTTWEARAWRKQRPKARRRSWSRWLSGFTSKLTLFPMIELTFCTVHHKLSKYLKWSSDNNALN